MRHEEIIAFNERDREYLRSRRQGGGGGGDGGDYYSRRGVGGGGVESARITDEDNDNYSYVFPRSTISSSPQSQMMDGGIRITYGTEFQNNGHLALEDSKNDEKGNAGDDDVNEEEPIVLTQSTHSLIFTEPICSVPFWFGLVVAAMSYACLILAMLHNMSYGEPGNLLDVPVQVTKPVRGAQYLSLVIGLLMEEEIPTGIFMLRMIPRQSLKSKFPKMRFWRFTFSALIRIVMGYIFLLNMFVVVVQATGVIDIFYDVLALQFVQQLDDICFSLARMDVFGKRMRTATTQKCFRVEFDRYPFSSSRRKGIFLRTLYFLNIFGLLSGMAIINMKQNRGDYYCNSITVTFGNEIWEDAIILTAEGNIESSVLVFSYFNGVYKKSDEMHNRRPVYVEQSKFDGTHYNTTIPAEIKYCESEQAWVFMHKHIRKSRRMDDGDCPWILSSMETTEFSLLEVPDTWRIWTGTINPDARLNTVCNECNSLADCNYHGTCTGGECTCEYGTGYFGTHCEHKQPCPVLVGDWNDTWYLTFIDEANFFVSYDRPVYTYLKGLNVSVEDEDVLALVYAGSRWFGMVFEDGESRGQSYWLQYGKDFHAFWEKAYSELTVIVSDTTSESDPVATDFYLIGERGKQYGPYGELWPMSQPIGSGFYRCEEDSNKITQIFNEVYSAVEVPAENQTTV